MFNKLKKNCEIMNGQIFMIKNMIKIFGGWYVKII